MGLATILDPTAGNRSIWRIKQHPSILYIDIEPELDISPDFVMNCTNTDLPDKHFISVFFDPPHSWGDKTGDNFYSCRNQAEREKFDKKYNMKRGRRNRSYSTYYGTDKYKTKTELLSFIHQAQKEFYRVLRDDGLLWLKWNEIKISLHKLLPFFKNWEEMRARARASPFQIAGDAQTYWIMFMKKAASGPKELELTDFSPSLTPMAESTNNSTGDKP